MSRNKPLGGTVYCLLANSTMKHLECNMWLRPSPPAFIDFIMALLMRKIDSVQNLLIIAEYGHLSPQLASVLIRR